MKKYLVGIDIGGTKCAAVLGYPIQTADGNGDFKFVDRICFATDVPRGPEKILSQLAESVHELLDRNSIACEQVDAIGISCGGPLDHKQGLIKNPPNLVGWDDIPVVQYMQQCFRVPVFLQNDANACALAEWKYGAAAGCRNVVFLTFGSGLGAGLILDGRLYNGTNDMAGEVGHIRLETSGPVGYGQAGSFEGFCSGNGLAQLARMKVMEQLQMGIHPSFCPNMESLEQLSAKSVAIAAKAGDPLAKEIFSVCGRYLGMGLSILIDILNPEMIVIGSVYERSGDLMQEALAEALDREALAISRNVCRIVPAKLGNQIGDYATLSVAMHGGHNDC